jgi:hypothetical protein
MSGIGDDETRRRYTHALEGLGAVGLDTKEGGKEHDILTATHTVCGKLFRSPKLFAAIVGQHWCVPLSIATVAQVTVAFCCDMRACRILRPSYVEACIAQRTLADEGAHLWKNGSAGETSSTSDAC